MLEVIERVMSILFLLGVTFAGVAIGLNQLSEFENRNGKCNLYEVFNDKSDGKKNV